MAPWVLIVDNNPMNLEFVHYILTSRRYEVKTSTSVDEGLGLMRETANIFG